MKSKSIVVPIDFSKESLNGLRLAIVFSNALKKNICMVYVQRKTTSDYLSVSVKEELEWAEAQFEEIIDKFKSKLKAGCKLNYKIRKGSIYEEVVNQAKYNDAYMIVCTTHGASGFEEFFMGSNAFRIVSASECPVLTIRKGICPSSITKIVLPIDTSEESRQKVPFACDLAELFKAELHVLCVSNSTSAETTKLLNAYLTQVSTYINNRKLQFQTKMITGSNIAKITMDYSELVKAELIVIMTEQETSTQNILLGTYAQQMVNRSNIPIITIRPEEKGKLNVFKY
ncbi:MAG: universal stress protein [Bacteroidales bacterium]|jgi:nucleotide-binding universal stress UspA family protein